MAGSGTEGCGQMHMCPPAGRPEPSISRAGALGCEFQASLLSLKVLLGRAGAGRHYIWPPKLGSQIESKCRATSCNPNPKASHDTHWQSN